MQGSKPIRRRVGIWCDYGFTLSPAQGIGVFVANLARGLVEADEQLEVILLTCPREPDAYRELARHPSGRIGLFPGTEHGWLVNSWLQFTQACYDLFGLANQRWLRVRSAARKAVVPWLVRHGKQAWAGRPDSLILLGGLFLLLPPLAAVLWLCFILVQAALCIFKSACFPLASIDRLVRRLTAVSDNPSANALAARCDVWIVPWVNLGVPLPRPAILLIHDLVHEHYPAAFSDPAEVVRLRSRSRERAAEATLVACMARFIRDSDLYGVLDLPRDKVRVLPLAFPADLPQLELGEVEALLPRQLKRPYILYPAGFRQYKNHRVLIEALDELRRRGFSPDLDLVFTGYDALPAELGQLAVELGVLDRIHVLDTVDRRTLAALYLRAHATFAPSLYEQGSFPIMEALQHGCPVACSDIPAFREQCAGMEDAICWFDPLDPASVADAIASITADREGVRRRQAEASKAVRHRTWSDVAAAWLPVLDEAIERRAWQNQLDRELLAPWPARPLRVSRVSDRRRVLVLSPRALPPVRWSAMATLLGRLAQQLESRASFEVAFAIAEDQPDRELLAEAPVLPCRMNHLTRLEAVELLGVERAELSTWGENDFVFPSGAALTALRADVWLVCNPSLPLPILPARPSVVLCTAGDWVTVSNRLASRNLASGTLPLLRRAEAVVVDHHGLARELQAWSQGLLEVEVGEDVERLIELLYAAIVTAGSRKAVLSVIETRAASA